jgi:hypothetical protein
MLLIVALISLSVAAVSTVAIVQLAKNVLATLITENQSVRSIKLSDVAVITIALTIWHMLQALLKVAK